jgi:hypothetical protein
LKLILEGVEKKINKPEFDFGSMEHMHKTLNGLNLDDCKPDNLDKDYSDPKKSIEKINTKL